MKMLVCLGTLALMTFVSPMSAFAADNSIKSEFNFSVEDVKAKAISKIYVNPSTIVRFNGHEYGSKNTVDNEYNISYENTEADVIGTYVVSPTTIVDIDVPLAEDYVPGYFKNR